MSKTEGAARSFHHRRHLAVKRLTSFATAALRGVLVDLETMMPCGQLTYHVAPAAFDLDDLADVLVPKVGDSLTLAMLLRTIGFLCSFADAGLRLLGRTGPSGHRDMHGRSL